MLNQLHTYVSYTCSFSKSFNNCCFWQKAKFYENPKRKKKLKVFYLLDLLEQQHSPCFFKLMQITLTLNLLNHMLLCITVHITVISTLYQHILLSFLPQYYSHLKLYYRYYYKYFHTIFCIKINVLLVAKVFIGFLFVTLTTTTKRV